MLPAVHGAPWTALSHVRSNRRGNSAVYNVFYKKKTQTELRAEGFVISALSRLVLAPGKPAVFTVQPEEGLEAGKHEANLTIRESGAADAGSYYGGAVMWAVANGITGGTSSTAFSPNAACTRA